MTQEVTLFSKRCPPVGSHHPRTTRYAEDPWIKITTNIGARCNRECLRRNVANMCNNDKKCEPTNLKSALNFGAASFVPIMTSLGT